MKCLLAFIHQLFILVLFSNFLTKVTSLKCYECNSLSDHNCLTARLLTPKTCTHEEAPYCLKLVGFVSDEGTFIIRMCSNGEEMHSGCRPQILDGSRTNVCFHRCYEDSCNSTNNTKPCISLLTICIIYTIVKLLCKTV